MSLSDGVHISRFLGHVTSFLYVFGAGLAAFLQQTALGFLHVSGGGINHSSLITFSLVLLAPAARIFGCSHALRVAFMDMLFDFFLGGLSFTD